MVDKAKLDAFRSYDFDSDDRWKAHLRNVELPAGAGATTALNKVKSKWYKNNVDADFDPAWASVGQSTASSGASPDQTQSQQQQQEPRQQARPPPNSSSRGSAANPGDRRECSKQLNLALLQAAVLLLTVMYLQPLNRGISGWAYRRLIMTLIILQGYKVYGAHGRPAAWRKDVVATWARRVLATSDAHYFILAAAAYVNPPVTALLVPYVVLAAYGLAYFLAQNHSSHPLWQKHGAPLYQKMVVQQQNALQINAQAEVMLGFQLLIGLLFPGRSPMLLLAVWHVLRLRYWSVDAAIHHHRVWAALDQMTFGIRQRVPVLQKAVAYGVKFFHAGRV